MAKANVTITCATCGKEFTVSKICRNCRDAESWEAWAARHYNTCQDCAREQQRQQTIAEANANNLPELEGSDKQIAWAMDIRAKFAKAANDIIAKTQKDLDAMQAAGNATPEHTATLAKGRKALAKLLGETSCRWWIDNRDANPMRLLQAEMAKIEDAPAEEAAEAAAETVTTAKTASSPESATSVKAAETAQSPKTNAQQTAKETGSPNAPRTWYAVMPRADATGWDTGSFDLEEAKAMARPHIPNGGYIAVISGGSAPACIDQIREL